MTEEEIRSYFKGIIKQDTDVSVGVAAIRTLKWYMQESNFDTIQELHNSLKFAIDIMKNSDYPVAAITSGSELFIRFITYVYGLDTKDIKECKEIMSKRGEQFLETLDKERGIIVKSASKFVTDGSKILLHSRSRVVLQTLIAASEQNKRFEVFVTCSAPDNSGQVMKKNLEAAGIQCTLILDSAIGYIMEQVNFIMVGAECIVESGGIVNKIGTYTMAVCAKEMKKPFYVLAESFKFLRIFPLNQQDLPDEYKYTSEVRKNIKDLSTKDPMVDYTPPSYITLLFTDLGVLTPSAISDVLIKRYT